MEYDIYAPPAEEDTGSQVPVMSETYSHKRCTSRRSPLFKLWMGVAWIFRQKFNLTVSAEMLVYQTVVSSGGTLNGHLRSGGGLLNKWAWPKLFQFYS
jgi:hypothetical protein